MDNASFMIERNPSHAKPLRMPLPYRSTGTNIGRRGGRERARMESNTLLNAWTTVQSMVVSNRSSYTRQT
jgi:hypothetical protein